MIGCSGKDHDWTQDPSNVDLNENHVTEGTVSSQKSVPLPTGVYILPKI